MAFRILAALIACLLAALSAGPAVAPAEIGLPSDGPFTEIEVEEVTETDDEGGEEEDEEWDEEDWEEEEDEEDDLASEPTECLIYTATARVTASTRRNTVRLSIRYASYEPARSTVDYWLKGGKGSLQLKASKRSISRRGHLSSVEHLSDSAMEKVQAARVFVVQIDPADTPAYCDRYFTLHLTSKRQTSRLTSWSEPRSGTQPLS